MKPSQHETSNDFLKQAGREQKIAAEHLEENAFEDKKKKATLNLTPGPWCHEEYCHASINFM